MNRTKGGGGGNTHGGSIGLSDILHRTSPNDRWRAIFHIEVHLWIRGLIRVIELWMIIKKVMVKIWQQCRWAQSQNIGWWLRGVDHIVKECRGFARSGGCRSSSRDWSRFGDNGLSCRCRRRRRRRRRRRSNRGCRLWMTSTRVCCCCYFC